VVGFAYSSGVFSSQEIIQQCYTDRWLRHCSGQTIPFRTELISFRRRHRIGIETILVEILRASLGWASLAPGEVDKMRVVAIQEAKARLELARHLDSCDE
jgi:hypothetical protein